MWATWTCEVDAVGVGVYEAQRSRICAHRARKVGSVGEVVGLRVKNQSRVMAIFVSPSFFFFFLSFFFF